MTTYTHGFDLKCKNIITKKDIIKMCILLNNREEYSNLCKFQPEGITEGGIIYKFKDNNKWYKSIRLCVNYNGSSGKWYRVNDNVMLEWKDNNDVIFNTNNEFTIFLKSFNGAPPFTITELKILEECFNEIGIINIGKYPSKNSLFT